MERGIGVECTLPLTLSNLVLLLLFPTNLICTCCLPVMLELMIKKNVVLECVNICIDITFIIIDNLSFSIPCLRFCSYPMCIPSAHTLLDTIQESLILLYAELKIPYLNLTPPSDLQ